MTNSLSVRHPDGWTPAPPAAVTVAGEKPIEILIVDDHLLLAEGIVRLVRREPDIGVVGVAGTCAEGLAAARALRPSVVLLDYLLPDGDGLEMAALLAAEMPDVKVVLLTGSGLPRALNGALAAKCAAYMDKSRAYHELVDVIRAVHAGETVYPLDRLAEMPRLDQLRVHYQPVMDLERDRPVGVEALVRWQHPTRGLLPPLDFIAAAEENGFIDELGVAVLEESCRQAVAWRAELPGAADLSVAVNVSPRQFDDAAFPAHVARALAQTGLPPQALVIEVTETSVADNPALVAERLRELHGLGVQIAVDDFGTGYASLQQLRDCPFQLLKLDRHFVAGVLTSEEDDAIVTATATLAHRLGLDVVAEGVETEEHLQRLRDLGCELGQGYLWSRPLPPEELGTWWREHSFTAREMPVEV